MNIILYFCRKSQICKIAVRTLNAKHNNGRRTIRQVQERLLEDNS